MNLFCKYAEDFREFICGLRRDFSGGANIARYYAVGESLNCMFAFLWHHYILFTSASIIY